MTFRIVGNSKGKKVLSDYVLSWLKGGTYYGANRGEIKSLSVRHFFFLSFFDNQHLKSLLLPISAPFYINSKVDFQSCGLLTLIFYFTSHQGIYTIGFSQNLVKNVLFSF